MINNKNNELLDFYNDFKNIHLKILPEFSKYQEIKYKLEEKIDELSKKGLVPWFEVLRLKYEFEYNKSDEIYNKNYGHFFEDFSINGKIEYRELTYDISTLKKSTEKIINSQPDNIKKYKKEFVNKLIEILEYLENNKIDFLINIHNDNYKYEIFNKIKGKFAEFKFQQFLNKHKKAFFVVDDNTETMPDVFRNNKGKRPDFFVMLENKFIIGIDVKNYRFKSNTEISCFGIQKTDIELYKNLFNVFPIPVFIAISNGNLSFKTWYFISVKDLIKKINNKPAGGGIIEEINQYNIPLNDFTNVFDDKFDDKNMIIKNRDELIEPVKKFINESLEKNI
jgi:hypothetical protein